jgi:hypothetical protein
MKSHSRRQKTELTQFPRTPHTRQRLFGSLIGSGARCDVDG